MQKAYDDTIPMSKIPEFFKGYNLNYTENVLANCDPNATAIISIREGESLNGERFTWRDLTECVRQARSALVRHGIHKGDRVAAYMSNNPYTIILFLAAAAMGAVFTSISPDMGADVRVFRAIWKPCADVMNRVFSLDYSRRLRLFSL